MDADHIRKRVTEIVAAEAGRAPDEVSDLTAPVADLGLDSLDLFRVACDLEDEFNIAIDDDKIARSLTVRELTQIVTDAANR